MFISKSRLTLPPVLNSIVLLFGLDFFVLNACKAASSIFLGIWATEILKISLIEQLVISLIEQFWVWFMYWAWFAILNFLLHNLHCVWSNDSIVSKSVEGLASVFEIFILHDGHWDSISVFPLNEAIKQFRHNLCSHFKIFIGFLIFSEQISHMQRETWGFESSLLTSCNVTVCWYYWFYL